MDYIVNGTDLTAVANAIRTKGETTGSLVFPAGFITAINDISTGGGSAAFAFIRVKVSDGQTVRCLLGTTPVAGVVNNGKTVFGVPSAGTYTIDVMEGSVVKRTQSVTIGDNDMGNCYDYNLSSFFIVENGEQTIQLSRFIRSGVTFSRSTSGGVLTLTGSSDSSTCGVSTATKVDLAPYSRLVAEVTSATKTSFTYSQLVVWNDSTGSNESAVNNAREKGTDIPANGGTIVVDISSYNTSKYVGFHSHVDSGKPTIKLTNMYLE